MKGIYADILLPLALEGLLTYRVPEELAGAAKRGQQVKVPVGKGIHTGVIFNVAEHTGAVSDPKEIRDIVAIVNALPIVSENALVLWEWIARYYMCPPGMVAKTGLSMYSFRRRAESVSEERDHVPVPGKPLYAEGPDRTGIYREHVRQTLSRGQQCLIICPDMVSCESIYEKLLPDFKEQLICFHSKRPLREQSRAKKELYAGNPVVVTGMQQSLFLPFTDPGLIVVEREEHPGHKRNDSAPHLHARDTALMMGQIYGSRVLLGSAVPSLETLHNTVTGKFGHLKTPDRVTDRENRIIITDTSDPFVQKNMKGFLDVRSYGALRECLDKGMEALLVEADPMSVENHVPVPGITVCKPFRTHHHLGKDIGMISFLHTEKLLSRKHFRATEQACHAAGNVMRWVAAQDKPVPVFFQSSDVDHPFYEALREGLSDSFLHHLLEERKRYGYPPFTRMIMLTVSHNKKTTALTKATMLLNRLGQEKWPARAEGPFLPFETRMVQFSYRLQITIPKNVKIQPLKEIISAAVKEMPLAPARCRIDVDPA